MEHPRLSRTLHVRAPSGAVDPVGLLPCRLIVIGAAGIITVSVGGSVGGGGGGGVLGSDEAAPDVDVAILDDADDGAGDRKRVRSPELLARNASNSSAPFRSWPGTSHSPQ